MKNTEILEKAIQKAIYGGWKAPESVERLADDLDNGCNCYGSLYDIIFSHDFAKALWGEETVGESYTGQGPDLLPATYMVQKSAWRHHLRQMVIAEDPIKYLGENL